LAELQKDPSKFLELLAVPFDLWLVSFGLVMGAAANTKRKDTRSLTWALGLAVVVLLAVIALLELGPYIPTSHPAWFKIYLPDLLALTLIGYAVHAAVD
jgi:hypothetical protein